MNGLKEAFSRKNLLKNLNFFALLNLGLVLTAVGIVYFKNPNHFAFGGTSGLSILLADLFPHINVGGFMWIINLVLVVLGFLFLGIKCMGWTIYSSFALSFFVSCCEWLYPSGVSLSGDAMLDLVFAVFLPALGAAIVFDIGASTGGTDIVALILAKYTSMEIGKALMVSDILIVLAAAVRFGMGTGLYCILGLIGKSFVVDGAIENIRLRKVCTIMTANPQPILDFIIHDMNRSATVEKAYGAYTHHELSVLVTVLTRRQALQANRPGLIDGGGVGIHVLRGVLGGIGLVVAGLSAADEGIEQHPRHQHQHQHQRGAEDAGALLAMDPAAGIHRLFAAVGKGFVLLAEGTGLIAIGEHFSALRAFQQAHGISSN